MVEYTTDTWRSYFWLCAALAGANVVLLLFFCPECNFYRPQAEQYTENIQLGPTKNDDDSDKETCSFREVVSTGEYTIHTPSFKDRLSPVRYGRNISFLKTLVNPLMLLRHPAVLWGIFTYGCCLSPQIIMM